MAVIKNKKTGMWEVRTYYKDLTGERKQKTKRGFAKKSEALEWERNFKLKENQSIINCLTRRWMNTMQSRNVRIGRLKAIMKRYPGVSRKNYFMR